VRALVSKGLHRHAQALRDRVLAASHEIAGPDADSAIARAALPFALALIAGELAKAFDVIPESAAVVKVVRWAWDAFQRSNDSSILDPEEQAVAHLRRWVAERWDVTIQDIARSNGYREAKGWYDKTTIYIPRERIAEATGNFVKETQI